MILSHAIALVPCFVHGGTFSCDPSTVCSLYVAERDGQVVGVERGDEGARQVYVCDPCMGSVNKLRAVIRPGEAPHETAAEYAERGPHEWPAGDESEGWPGA